MNAQAILAGGAVTIAVLWWLGRQASNAVDDVAESVSPLNPDNVFSNIADSITQIFADDPNTTLGGEIHDFFNDGDT